MAMEKEDNITILVVEPHKHPYAKTIPNTLDALQHEVGGDIEVTYPYEDMVGLICNEEGKITGLDFNRSLRDEYGNRYDVIAGTFMIVGLDDDIGEFRSLTTEEMDKFKNLFYPIETFFRRMGRILSVEQKE
jgi:hypothetical protein